MSGTILEPSYIDGQRGRLFVLLRRPALVRACPCVLFIPPFAEEMNKTRPMLTMVAKGLAKHGIATVLPDLYGTGDSAGEFYDADVETWQDDLLRVAAWSESLGCPVKQLFGIRLGCLLAAELARQLTKPVVRTVFWQPVIDGERFVTQFLRLRVAASMMQDRREGVDELRDRIGAGERLEVAGYEVSQALVAQLDSARLSPLPGERLGQLHWMEVVRGDEATLSTQSQRAIDVARSAQANIETHAIRGEPYWSATEIVLNPELVDRTVMALAPAA